MWARRCSHCRIEGNDAIAEQRAQVLIERLHPVVAAFGNQRVDRGRLVWIRDRIGDTARVDANLDSDAAAETISTRYEPLTQDSA